MLFRSALTIILLLFICTQLKAQNHKPVIYANDDFRYNLIAVAQEYIMISTNGGYNWTTVYQGVYGEQFYTITFINDTVGFVMGATNESKIGGIVKTIDGGINWIDQASSLPDIISNKNIDSSTDELSTSIYAGGSSGLHLKYNNGIWTDVSRGGTDTWTEGMYAFNDSTVIGVGSGSYNISRTINSGKNWTSPNIKPGELMIDLSFNGNIGYAINCQEETPNEIGRAHV